MRKSKISRKKLAFWGLAVVIVFGLGYYFYGKISADTDLVPKTIPAGWSMIDGQSLNSLSLSKVLQSGVLIYSYNDPNTNNTGWTYATNNCQRFKSVSSMPCVDTLSLSPSLSYLTYNKYSPFTFPIVNFTKLSNYQNGYRSGWHILSWQESGTKRADFLKKISLKLANNSTASADYMIDRKYISSSIFQEDLSSQSIFQSFGFKDDASNVSRLTKGNAWMYFNGPDLTISQITSAPTSKGAFSFGLNVSPNSITPATNDGANFNQDATNLGATFIRYVNFDLYASTRQSDLDKANSLKDSGNELLGNLMPYGSSIANDRNSSILSSKGTKYSTSAEIDYDINLYSGVSPDGITPAQSPNWDKLKTLLIEEYFKAIVIPRVTLYKDTIKYWQPWNEPDGKIGNTQWGISSQALSLLTTGQVKTSNSVVSFGSTQITGLDGKKYSINRGASGLTKTICPDCKMVAPGFYRNVESYFTTLHDNNYMDYVDANEIHLNLQPSYSMGYTRYWTSLPGTTKIYDWLCGGAENCKKPLYSTETGSPGGIKFINTLNDQPTGFTMSYSNNFQADDLIKRFVSMSAQGLSKIDWNGYLDNHASNYKDRSCPTTPDSSGLYDITSPNALCGHPLKGLYQTSNTGFVQKPSYSAFSIATSMLGYANKIEILQQGDSDHNNADPIFLFKITDTDGKQKFSGWCEPYWNVKTEDLGQKNWQYENRDCSKTIDLSQYGLSAKALITNRDGSTKATNANNVILTKSPIFIEAR